MDLAALRHGIFLIRLNLTLHQMNSHLTVNREVSKETLNGVNFQLSLRQRGKVVAWEGGALASGLAILESRLTSY